MKSLFLSFDPLVAAVKSGAPMDEALIFLDEERDAYFFHPLSAKAVWDVIYAAEDASVRRIAWRPANQFQIQNALSELLEANGLAPLNPNLPPLHSNDFLKVAVERVNNKDGAVRVTVFA